MEFEKTAVRIWKRLTREERLAASVAFWHEPPEIVVGSAIAAIVKARHMRPQAARSLSEDERVRALAAILDPGEALASSLLVSLHLGERRPILAAFLDAAGLPHDQGVLKEEPSAPVAAVTEDAARKGVEALAAAYPTETILTYLNTLWLQDPDRWSMLTKAGEWLAREARTPPGGR